MAVRNPIVVKKAEEPVTEGDYRVRFIDFNGDILKTQYVDKGESATAPTPPTHEYLTFQEWNNPLDNIQRDIDTGACYTTTSGQTYLFIRITETSGKQPSLHINKADTALTTIAWGDGETSTSEMSGNNILTKPTPYSPGDYMVTIESAGDYSFYTYIFGVDVEYRLILRKAYLSLDVTAIGNDTFRAATSLEFITIPNGVGSLGTYAFFACRSLVALILPNSITFLLSHTIRLCSSLQFLIFSANHSRIDSFNQDCPSITELTLPPDSDPASTRSMLDGFSSLRKLQILDGFTSAGLNTFRDLYSLKEVTLPYDFITLGSSFSNCSSLIKYVFLTVTPITLTTTAGFDGINHICKMYFPDSSLNDYKTASNWIEFADYMHPISELPEYAGTIFFQTNEGTLVKHIQGEEGTTATEPDPPTRDGFVFDGWHKDELLTDAWDWNVDTFPATNLTLYAKWNPE